MYDVSVSMALVDYIPVILFGITAALLQKDLFGKMSRGSYTLFAAGTVEIFTAGFLKATWKLLYAAGICDFAIFNKMMMPLQSLGFLLIGISMIATLCRKSRKKAALAVVPPVFGGTVIFIMMMVLGLGSLCACLSVLAVKLKKKLPVALFVLSFVCYMGMGYLSSRDSTSAAINWIEQGINCLGQALLLGGTVILHKAGLEQLSLEKE